MMKVKLILLLALLTSLPAWAATGVRGVVIDARSNQPVAGATVVLDEQGAQTTTGPDGVFLISDVEPGNDVLLVIGYGFDDWSMPIQISQDLVTDAGTIKVGKLNAAQQGYEEAMSEMTVTAAQLEDEEGNAQAVSLLTGANDDPFYQAASYDFSVARFRLRGYNSEYTQTAINGIMFNDAARGRFNYSMIGGMNQAFRNKAIANGLEASSFSLGDIGGTNNILLYAKDYAPGMRASVAYTNGNYTWRGMLTYATGLRPNGWALTLSAVTRYAKEGIIPGSLYKSVGYFVSAQKVFNPKHSIAITTFGAPTSRASNSATFLEAYQLAGSNLYNSNWGWQEGKKRNARTVKTFDPTVLLNWIWTPDRNTTLNTGLAFHKSYYASGALNWYNAADPRPDYYRYLPSYYEETSPDVAEYYRNQWLNNESVRQIDWNRMYQVNYLNNAEGKGATYIVEDRNSNQSSWALNTNLNTALTDVTKFQAGLAANYTISSYYKTISDLLGGSYWTDVDQFAERDFPGDPGRLQNDLNNPNRKLGKGGRFGYDYNINQLNANLWSQGLTTLPKWEFNYGLNLAYTTYYRDGKMRNGRAPENSYGKGQTHNFFNYAVKAGAIYKIDGRNSFAAHIYAGTKAPLSYNAYISPRIKDDVIADLKSEKILSADLSYSWNYRNFKGSITGFYTDLRDGTERTVFYDDYNTTFVNYALTGVNKVYKGVEVGLLYKLTTQLSVEAAANIGSYRYKNRPTGTRNFENGSKEDLTQTVYLKNFFVGGTPQEAYSIGLNWAAPKMWFFEVKGIYLNRAYIELSPIRHEALPDLYKVAEDEADLKQKIANIAKQEKLNDAFVLNLSVGKVIYLSRSASLNLNLNVQNALNNKDIQTGGFQQGRFDYKNYTTAKFPNKYYYAQGTRVFFNVGVKF